VKRARSRDKRDEKESPCSDKFFIHLHRAGPFYSSDNKKRDLFGGDYAAFFAQFECAPESAHHMKRCLAQSILGKGEYRGVRIEKRWSQQSNLAANRICRDVTTSAIEIELLMFC
jgi:hypothetical protein